MNGTRAELPVLFVDDEPILRGVAKVLLERRFSVVYTAEHGKEGLELFKLHGPNIVITDINMPEMDGIEMTREIRKLCSRTPIIIISANHYDDLAENLNSMDPIRFIQKPVNMSQFFQMIDDLKKQESAWVNRYLYGTGI